MSVVFGSSNQAINIGDGLLSYVHQKDISSKSSQSDTWHRQQALNLSVHYLRFWVNILCLGSSEYLARALGSVRM